MKSLRKHLKVKGLKIFKFTKSSQLQGIQEKLLQNQSDIPFIYQLQKQQQCYLKIVNVSQHEFHFLVCHFFFNSCSQYYLKPGLNDAVVYRKKHIQTFYQHILEIKILILSKAQQKVGNQLVDSTLSSDKKESLI
ncbi:hypothetical protein pb186bvf_000871 [Paramecium bursaria]